MRLSLVATRREVDAQVSRLLSILNDMPATAASRYALAEIVLIRASAVFEAALANLAYKIACGASFENGKVDTVIIPCRSMAFARQQMLCAGGGLAKPRPWLKWTKAKFISESVQGVISPTSHFVTSCQNFGSQISDMFAVRHHVAHKNQSSRTSYMAVVKRQYGQERRIQVGYFLLTKNLSSVSNIERYLKNMSVIIDHIVSGP